MSIRHTLSRHDLLQTISFYKQFFVALLAAGVVLFFDVDDRTADSWHSLKDFWLGLSLTHEQKAHLYDNLWQRALQFTKSIVFICTIDIDPESVLARNDSNGL
jgi:hypothetical protein